MNSDQEMKQWREAWQAEPPVSAPRVCGDPQQSHPTRKIPTFQIHSHRAPAAYTSGGQCHLRFGDTQC